MWSKTYFDPRAGSAIPSLPPNMSLQLTGTGSTYAAFTWSGPVAHSRGAINAGQTIQ